MNKLVQISIVIPVYLGEKTLRNLIDEIKPLTECSITQTGVDFQVLEVILVHDCGPDQSDKIIEELANEYKFIRPIWLSRNFGQHAATLCGMSSSRGDWVLTVDEDGQHNPFYLEEMLDIATSQSLQIVYGRPTNSAPHGFIRNIFSLLAKYIASKLLGRTFELTNFSSFRLIDGEIARILAAYCGRGVYLDVGLSWVSSRVGFSSVILREEKRKSGYSYRKLFHHFWTLIFSSGTGPLRMIALIGAFSVAISFCLFGYAMYAKWVIHSAVQGWTSLLIITSFFSGLIMFSLGVVAEYLAITAGIVMGRPLYIVSSRPTRNHY
ncbi:glycosyltransferase [Polynucleobacter paneuropaeus]|nr:glycosyltransferase [Polynucleobacter paneuropaeus]